MIPRLDIRFPLKRQWLYWHGEEYAPPKGEYLLNHARTGIVMALRAALPKGGRVGVVAYNCHTVANAVVNAGCVPKYMDVTEQLTIDIQTVPSDLDAIVVTNLFGIRNNIAAIKKRCPSAVVIVDNAHGYGLPAEGDFTVYSINQGKFPALGEGGILKVAPYILDFRLQIANLYSLLPKYNKLAQIKLFCAMLMKAVAYSKLCYWFVRRLKKNANPEVHEQVELKQMAPGIRRLYQAWLLNADAEIAKQKRNAERIRGLGISGLVDEWLEGDNAFMLVAKTHNLEELKKWFAEQGIETATHFKHCIEWAKEFGYMEGTCPNAEYLTQHLLMIPTYNCLSV